MPRSTFPTMQAHTHAHARTHTHAHAHPHTHTPTHACMIWVNQYRIADSTGARKHLAINC